MCSSFLSRLGPGLYAITNGPRPDLLERSKAVLEGGAKLLQYRDKSADTARRQAEAQTLKVLCDTYQVPLLINDDIELALSVGAAGVHLGRDDDAPNEARARLGTQALIGVSCYNSLERAQALAKTGVDYLAFGAFFPSITKPQAVRAEFCLLRQATALGLPRVAIGGITPNNAAALIHAGADYLAVISAVYDAADSAAAARAFTDLYSGVHT